MVIATVDGLEAPTSATSYWQLIEQASLINGCIDKYRIYATITDNAPFDDYNPGTYEFMFPTGITLLSFVFPYTASLTSNLVFGRLYPKKHPLYSQVNIGNAGNIILDYATFAPMPVEVWFHRNNPDMSVPGWLGTQPDPVAYGAWIYHISGTIPEPFTVKSRFTYRKYSDSYNVYYNDSTLPLSIPPAQCVSAPTGIIIPPGPPPPPTPVPTPTPIPVPSGSFILPEKEILNFNCAPGWKEQSPSLIPNYYLNDVNLPAIKSASRLESGFPRWMDINSCGILHRCLSGYGNNLNVLEKAINRVGSIYSNILLDQEPHNVWRIDLPKELLQSTFQVSVSGHVIPETNKFDFEDAYGLCFIKDIQKDSGFLWVKNLSRVNEVVQSSGQVVNIPTKDSSYPVFTSPLKYSVLQPDRWRPVSETSVYLASGTHILSYVKKEYEKTKTFYIKTNEKTYTLTGYYDNLASSLRNALRYRGISIPAQVESSEGLQRLFLWELFENSPPRTRSLYKIGDSLNLLQSQIIYRNSVTVTGTVLLPNTLLPVYFTETIKNNTISSRNLYYGKTDKNIYVSSSGGYVTGSIIKSIKYPLRQINNVIYPSVDIHDPEYIATLSGLVITNLMDISYNRLHTISGPSMLYYDIIRELNSLRKITYGSFKWVNSFISTTTLSNKLNVTFED